MLVKMGLLRVKEELLKDILAIRDKLFLPKDRVLGVHLRGTDYVATKLRNRLKGHPIPPPRVCD